MISIFWNDLERSLSNVNVCYILYKNNINKNDKTLKNEQRIRSRDAAAKKELIHFFGSSMDDNFGEWVESMVVVSGRV